MTVTGALDAAVVRRIVQRNAAQLSYCHERAVSTQPDAHGHFVLRIVVGDDGGVLSTSVASGTASPPSLGQCAASAARRWQFPRPSDGAIVTISVALAFDEVRGARR